ncbi:ATP-binding protein [Marinobacter sp. F4216]|uniref:ATP-binding protein n=1 Tax=Marinobacter sp. F4216 TaxID=2874281 RepID=UPI001CBE186C|nr:AAA family ATPase [Marinobacter sp. F4216]MBZ2168267.1 AAA family ATPase [Marinobacter sp. F4216]
MNRSASAPSLRINLLGPMSIEADGHPLNLPRSKKTRALLAYLIMSDRSLRRDKLGELFWDITEDPKGSLRWSLSRLRREIQWDRERLHASRQELSFDRAGAFVDAWELAALEGQGFESLPLEALVALADVPRGSFLEELELQDIFQFNAWCVGQRERFRGLWCQLLTALRDRQMGEPDLALGYAVRLSELDPFDVTNLSTLFELLFKLGRRDEAQKRYEHSRRLFKDLGAAGETELHRAWIVCREQSRQAMPAPNAAARTVSPPAGMGAALPFIGRSKELMFIEDEMGRLAAGEAVSAFLFQGEPGIGKSRLAERLMSKAESAGFAVRAGRAYEVEQKSPYKPWLDALGLALSDLVQPDQADSEIDQERWFSLVRDELQQQARGKGLLLILDDLQWFDRASLQLLHYVARSFRSCPLMFGLFARAGELRDNAPAQRVILSLQQDFGARVFDLAPLGESDIGQLLSGQGSVDANRIYRASSGNPLYAIEMARHPELSDPYRPLVNLVRDRIEHLPEQAIDLVRWGAVLGRSISIPRLERLCSLEPEVLVEGLECLETHALFQIDATHSSQRYRFSHDVVRQAVYSDLSLPRRRLMHKKVVELLLPEIDNLEVATEIAYHAERAGEALEGARACVLAGEQALRVFANGVAESLARQGLQMAEQLQGNERIGWMLKLLHILYSAQKPDTETASIQLRDLAEQALAAGLTHEARLGFQMLSFLRWENASMASAHSNILQAERISRREKPEERAEALAQAAKCFLLLERNLNQAEAFILEVKSLFNHGIGPISTAYLAEGMLAGYRGHYKDAERAFQKAIDTALEAGERLEEFAATEQLIMLHVDRGNLSACDVLIDQLLDLGQRVRAGVELPVSETLSALVRYMNGEEGALDAFKSGLEALRALDDKYHVAYLLSRLAGHQWKQGLWPAAASSAQEALDCAMAIGRESEIAIANHILRMCAQKDGADAREDGDAPGAESATHRSWYASQWAQVASDCESVASA